MSKRLTLACAALAAVHCATPAATKPDDKKKEPVMEKMAVRNNSLFDIGVCNARPMTLKPVSEEVVVGALVSRGPAFQECFLDAKAREGNPPDIKVKLTVSDAGLVAEATGTGLSVLAKACLEDAAKKLPFEALAKGEAPVSGEVPVTMSDKMVTFGVNAGSDVAGTLRLAMTSMCDCFAEIGDKPAPQPVMKIKLTKDAPPQLTVEATGDFPALATCLTDRAKTLPLPNADLEMPFPFLLVSSNATEANASAAPPMQFQQLEAIRAQRTADVLISAGQRGKAALRYDEVVKKYKAKPAPSLIAELRTKCAAVLAGDDANIKALKALVGVYQTEMTLAQAQKATDAAWGAVEEGLSKQLTQTSAEVTRVEGQRVNDQKACPKDR